VSWEGKEKTEEVSKDIDVAEEVRERALEVLNKVHVALLPREIRMSEAIEPNVGSSAPSKEVDVQLGRKWC
jgi:hypothetical protein